MSFRQPHNEVTAWTMHVVREGEESWVQGGGGVMGAQALQGGDTSPCDAGSVGKDTMPLSKATGLDCMAQRARL